MSDVIRDILRENAKRHEEIERKFNPITGEGSILQDERVEVTIEDMSLGTMYLPRAMTEVSLVKKLMEYGSISKFLMSINEDVTEENKEEVLRQFIRVRTRYDFAFWCAMYVYIKAKGGGEDILFKLNRPQRRLVEMFERMRSDGKPIRVILLKARQWGGSTVTQIYMAWLQLVHKVGLNSLIVGHVKDSSIEVKDMFDKLIKNYPTELLHELGEKYDKNESKLIGVGQSSNIQRIPQRNCKIKIGTAEKPNSARGGDYNLVHCTEVGLWTNTEGKTPQQIVRSACSGVTYNAYTMVVYESTANGVGNFFQKEYDSAKKGISQFSPLFIAWYDIEMYSNKVDDLESFAKALYDNRENENVMSSREECGKYLWYLWESGATLEAIAWYKEERKKYDDHGDIASEFPSDDIEAFTYSGARVFDQYKVNDMKKYCKPPRMVGDVYGDGIEGEDALSNLKFAEDKQGKLWVWSEPDIDEDHEVSNRYLVVVDIGGRSNKADWSVIMVLDRLNMIECGRPVVVAQWYGHIDMDLLAWKSAQIATWYDNALLVIESNTLETHDKERQVDGDLSGYILNQIKGLYDNLYARRQSEEDIKNKVPVKYGFHTNVGNKPSLVHTLVKAVRDCAYIERDERCLEEFLCYEQKQNGAYGAILGKHDDLLMTRAIALYISFGEMDVPEIREKRRMTIEANKRPSQGVATI